MISIAVICFNSFAVGMLVMLTGWKLSCPNGGWTFSIRSGIVLAAINALGPIMYFATH